MADTPTPPAPRSASADSDAWLDALDSGEIPAVNDPEPSRLLHEFVRATGYDLDAVRNGWRMLIALPDGRHQAVFAHHGGTDAEKRAILSLISICGPANDRDLRRLLQFNARAVDGHFAIKVLRGEEYFVVVRNIPLERAGQLDARGIVRRISETADGLERRISGGRDVY